MTYKHIFLSKAQEEYERSIKWYAESSLQAFDKFCNRGRFCPQTNLRSPFTMEK